MTAYISIIGLINWNENIVKDCFLDTFIKLFGTSATAQTMYERFEDLMVYECGDLECTLPNPAFFSRICKSWVNNKETEWTAYYKVQTDIVGKSVDYLVGRKNENYTESETVESSGEDGRTITSKSSGSNDTTTDTSVYGFNESSGKPKDSVVDSVTRSDTGSSTESGNNSNNVDRSKQTHKDITDYSTVFDNFKGFDEVAGMNVINKIVMDFRDRFCLLVY